MEDKIKSAIEQRKKDILSIKEKLNANEEEKQKLLQELLRADGALTELVKLLG